MEDDILLALAQAQISSRRLKRALAILEGLIRDQSARKIETVDLWVGWGTGAGGSEVKELYEESPDFTSDHALLALAHLHRRLGNLEKSWETFEKLRDKYRQGDRVQEDLLLMAQFRKIHPQLPKRLIAFRLKALPPNATPGTNRRYVVGSDPQAARLSELFLRRRRPHLRGLQEQAALCHKMKRRPEECVDIVKDIVTIYDPLLTEEELTRYCHQGLAEIESLRGKAEGAALERLEEARKVFTQALEKLAQEKSEPSGKDQHDTGAKE